MGGRLLAATCPSAEGTGRKEIQRFIRELLENPHKASEFLDSPETVAKELGIALSERDSRKIQNAINRVAATKKKIKGKTKLGPGGRMDHEKVPWMDAASRTKARTKKKTKTKQRTKTKQKMRTK